MKWMKIEVITLRNALNERLQYRFDFVVSFIGIGLAQIVIPLYTLLLYGVSQGFPGWSLAEAFLLASYVSLAQAITSVFFNGIIWNTVKQVQKGTMDTWLLAPTNPLAYFMNRSVDVEDSGRVIFSLLACIYALHLLSASASTIFFLILYLVVPIAMFAAIGILASAFSIRYVETFRIYDVIHYVTSVAKYPVSIFPKMIQIVLFSALPVAAAGVVPIQVIFQSKELYVLASALVVFVMLIGAIKYWHYTLKNYASAGG